MTDEAQQTLSSILRTNGYSATAARRYVCELLWAREPQSMNDLIKLAAGNIDRASLYRTVTLFEKLGLIQRIYIGWKYKIELSDVLSHHHHHLSCTACGKVVAITEEADIESLIQTLARQHNFVAQAHQLEISGLCPKCSKTV